MRNSVSHLVWQWWSVKLLHSSVCHLLCWPLCSNSMTFLCSDGWQWRRRRPQWWWGCYCQSINRFRTVFSKPICLVFKPLYISTSVKIADFSHLWTQLLPSSCFKPDKWPILHGHYQNRHQSSAIKVMWQKKQKSCKTNCSHLLESNSFVMLCWSFSTSFQLLQLSKQSYAKPEGQNWRI